MPGNEVVLGHDQGSAVPRNPLPEPPQPPPAPPEGGLLPLSRVAIARELAPGTGCALDESARGPLLVSVAGDAIVNDGGRIVHLRSDAKNLEELARGGRFVGDELVITIERGNQAERSDGDATWDASLRIERGQVGFVSFHHRWTCGK